jgi:heme/copper-type cytochrome/quinol oxidase subunit 3
VHLCLSSKYQISSTLQLLGSGSLLSSVFLKTAAATLVSRLREGWINKFKILTADFGWKFVTGNVYKEKCELKN